MLKILGLSFLILVFFANLAKAEIITNYFACQSEADIFPRFFSLYTNNGLRDFLLEKVYFHENKGAALWRYLVLEFEEDDDTLNWKYQDFYFIAKINAEEIKPVVLNIGKNSDWHHSIDKKTPKLTLKNVSAINGDQLETMIYANTEEFEWQCEMLDFLKYKGKQAAYRDFLKYTVPKKAGYKF